MKPLKLKKADNFKSQPSTVLWAMTIVLTAVNLDTKAMLVQTGLQSPESQLSVLSAVTDRILLQIVLKKRFKAQALACIMN